jgi:hypothetical protein
MNYVNEEQNKIFDKYFQIDCDEGINFPLMKEYFNGKDCVELQSGDVFYVNKDGIKFLHIGDYGRDYFVSHKNLYSNRDFIYANSSLRAVGKDKAVFKDITKKMTRNKTIDKLLDS